MKIVLHGFGMFAVTMRHLLDITRTAAPDIEWAVILPTGHQRHVFADAIPARDTLCLEEVQRRQVAEVRDLSELKDYCGSICVDIETEKRTFKHRPAWNQLARAVDIYRLYKDFLLRIGATHLLISQVEGLEGKMLISVGHELGLEVMVPYPCRNLGGTFFSCDVQEGLPDYRSATPELRDRAEKFIKHFRREAITAAPLPDHYDVNDELLDNFVPPLAKRATSFIMRALHHPELFELDHLRASILNNLPWLRNSIWWARKKLAEHQYDVDTVERLPSRFVFYPLQTTPESSINTPAPYFVDQMRAIDAIRFAMPSDCLLVIKEHPSAILTRDIGFVRALRRRAGVVIAQYQMPSRTLIERAACTISVTGTATFEAFLLGRQSLVLGPSFVANYLGGVCPIDQLASRIRSSIDHCVEYQNIVRAVAEILSVRRDFTFQAPGAPGEPTLRRQNLANMSDALLEHIRRAAAPRATAP